MPSNQTPCRRRAACGAPCVANGKVRHTIHTCGEPGCIDCHSGKVNIDAMLARRRAARLREQAELDVEMEGLDD